MSHDPSEGHSIPNSAVATSASSSVRRGHPRTCSRNSAPALKTGPKVQCWETGGRFIELFMKGEQAHGAPAGSPCCSFQTLAGQPAWHLWAYMMVRISNSKHGLPSWFCGCRGCWDSTARPGCWMGLSLSHTQPGAAVSLAVNTEPTCSPASPNAPHRHAPGLPRAKKEVTELCSFPVLSEAPR